jgi:hypothetical protein
MEDLKMWLTALLLALLIAVCAFALGWKCAEAWFTTRNAADEIMVNPLGLYGRDGKMINAEESAER